jgi:ATP-binding cassette subfamily F protein 3
MLEKLVIVQVDEVDTSALKLKFPPAARSGQYPVIVKDLSKSYGDHVVFKDANIVERGEKSLSWGKNGEGKSTMIKAIMKKLKLMVKLLDENATIF